MNKYLVQNTYSKSIKRRDVDNTPQDTTLEDKSNLITKDLNQGYSELITIAGINRNLLQLLNNDIINIRNIAFNKHLSGSNEFSGIFQVWSSTHKNYARNDILWYVERIDKENVSIHLIKSNINNNATTPDIERDGQEWTFLQPYINIFDNKPLLDSTLHEIIRIMLNQLHFGIEDDEKISSSNALVQAFRDYFRDYLKENATEDDVIKLLLSNLDSKDTEATDDPLKKYLHCDLENIVEDRKQYFLPIKRYGFFNNNSTFVGICDEIPRQYIDYDIQFRFKYNYNYSNKIVLKGTNYDIELNKNAIVDNTDYFATEDDVKRYFKVEEDEPKIIYYQLIEFPKRFLTKRYSILYSILNNSEIYLQDYLISNNIFIVNKTNSSMIVCNEFKLESLLAQIDQKQFENIVDEYMKDIVFQMKISGKITSSLI